ncbi:demethoxyubiquinone hydroxylase family protein [Parvibaculum sp.]|jgi:3-demethoxyubiquinol 3-hydroxylase|uniref:demethoxyubiquinone hydroxylase family protein n=1 Tax=Parvibaculum sp. TaxID=2024848 RepID=UPI000C4E4F40|nr:demethoxyubiquinone hydroxylase family protein [Parvibaculum sp.]MAM93133.1 demethoxyubiquinone hydroxylase family protein [Parvibaculum sp.]HCX67202.1 demethoxyubiquinone hydroxylase family protein [Rhodobiaceae bacterium]|tara:strand:- start:32665 stop:33255 length:591 start_codon:yes stop_codon:yes gene_type:complete
MTGKEIKPKSPRISAQPGRTREDAIEEMIRVDHAGEYGAVRIYEGQRAVFRALPHKQEIANTLERMAKDEEVHLARFNELVNERQVRPTALAPVWHVAGFALGAATALLGEKAAHACTAAVEEVIDEHYKSQVNRLDQMGEEEKPLRDTIEKFRLEEVEHRDEAIAAGAKEAPAYPLLSGTIKAACRLAIRISEKA